MTTETPITITIDYSRGEDRTAVCFKHGDEVQFLYGQIAEDIHNIISGKIHRHRIDIEQPVEYLKKENVRLLNDAITLITKSLSGMLTDATFASPYIEDNRPTTPRWVIAKFRHDHDRRIAYVNDIKQRLDWIRNATEAVR